MDKKQVKDRLEPVEWNAKEILKSIDRVRSARNREEEDIYLGPLKNAVMGLGEAWQIFERSLDPPE